MFDEHVEEHIEVQHEDLLRGEAKHGTLPKCQEFRSRTCALSPGEPRVVTCILQTSTSTCCTPICKQHGDAQCVLHLLEHYLFLMDMEAGNPEARAAQLLLAKCVPRPNPLVRQRTLGTRMAMAKQCFLQDASILTAT